MLPHPEKRSIQRKFDVKDFKFFEVKLELRKGKSNERIKGRLIE